MNANFKLCIIWILVHSLMILSVGSSTSLFPNSVNGSSSKANGTSESSLDIGTVDVIQDPKERAEKFENILKKFFKANVKRILPTLTEYGTNGDISKKCTRSIFKFLADLTNVKLWAVQMLDATSKPPSGILEGTFSDYGAFDHCLDISVPYRNGTEDFRGSYCSVEARPFMSPIPRNFTVTQVKHAGPMDTVGDQIFAGNDIFYYLKLRFGICLPSTCTEEDVRTIVKPISKLTHLEIKIPRCYKKEPLRFEVIQILVILILILLTALVAAGTAVDNFKESWKFLEEKQENVLLKILTCFSLIKNYKKLTSSSSDDSNHFKSLHGIRSLSMAWVILGHTYVWINFQMLRHPNRALEIFRSFTFETVLNAWLSVEPFFVMSGLLTSYYCIKLMAKSNGKLNIPIFIFHRYIRLAPSLLMVMGLMFLVPLVSSGPFWYETVDVEIQSCRKNWWTSLLFISNWTSMLQICIHPTWYLSADMQLHVFSLVVLYALHRSTKLGYSVMAFFTFISTIAIGIITYVWDLPPFIHISSADQRKITDTVDLIHVRTFSHVGPYCVGLLTGYLILKYEDEKLSKRNCIFGWSASFAASAVSLYGVHQWNLGNSPGILWTCLYAAVHRTTFAAGVSWVMFACVTGQAGLVNGLLSSSLFAFFSRLSFMAYLIQSLVIWVRKASARERIFCSHYRWSYEYIGNVVVTFALSFVLHLLLEAPIANLHRLMLRQKSRDDDEKQPTTTEGLEVSKDLNNVQLKSVKASPTTAPT